MKQGSTFVLVVDLQLDMSYVKSIIFTLKNKGKILTKENWSFEDGKFKIPFTQEETVQLEGRTLIEAQINFEDGNVAKSEIKEIFIKESLATSIVEGNKATEEIQEIGLAIDGDVVYTDGVGGGDYKLPIATESTLGGVKPLNKTKEMTQEVGVDKDGRLFAKGKDITVDSELSEESTNPVQNKVITAEVIALRERNAELEQTIEKLQIKVTTEPSPYHHITDSANMKVVDFGLEGKIEQRTTSGKNKLNTSALVEKTICGVTFTPYYTDGLLDYVLVNGTATESTMYRLGSCDDVYLSVDKLIFNGCPSGGSTTTYMLVHVTTGASDIGNGMNQTCSYLKDLNYAIKIMGGTTVSNLKFYPMVRLATETDATYEPYSDMPAPNPDYKQPITLAGVLNEETGRYEHKGCVVNKNLWDTEYASVRSNWFVNTEDNAAYPTIKVKVLKGMQVTVSYKKSLQTGQGKYVCVAKTNNTEKGNYGWLYHSGSTDLINNSIAFVAESDYVYIGCSGVQWDYLDNLDWFMENIGNDLQIEISSSATELLPHASQPFTITSDRPLTMWDNLVKVDGKWYWDYKQLKLVVDGNAGWDLYSNASKTFYVYNILPNVCSRREGYCNQLRVDTYGANTANGLWIGINNNQALYMCYSDFYDSTLSDKGLANLKAHLNEHPLEIYTYKDESELVPLLDEEQTLLNNLETYYGVTNVYNEQGCPITLTYVNDTKLYVDQKLLEIQQAMI